MTQHSPSTTRFFAWRHLLPLLALGGCGGGSPSAAAAPAAPVEAALALPADYQLVWADEFDTPGLPDPARWDYDTARNTQTTAQRMRMGA